MAGSNAIHLLDEDGAGTSLAVAVCFSLGATDADARLNTLSHRLMCHCGCAQLLGECDHVGCPSVSKEWPN